MGLRTYNLVKIVGTTINEWLNAVAPTIKYTVVF